jgi:hypothetical protein
VQLLSEETVGLIMPAPGEHLHPVVGEVDLDAIVAKSIFLQP